MKERKNLISNIFNVTMMIIFALDINIIVVLFYIKTIQYDNVNYSSII